MEVNNIEDINLEMIIEKIRDGQPFFIKTQNWDDIKIIESLAKECGAVPRDASIGGHCTKLGSDIFAIYFRADRGKLLTDRKALQAVIDLY